MMMAEDEIVADDHGAGLTRRIATSLRDEIIHGHLQVGQRLPAEADLARRFNASKPTVREAMKMLAAQNLTQSRRGPNGGIFVSRPTLDQTNRLLTSVTTWLVTLGIFSREDIAEARRSLGQACVGLAAQRRSETDLFLLERELQRMADAGGSNEQFCNADVKFHGTIANASGNRVLQLIMLIVNDSLAAATRMMVFRYHQRETIVSFNTRLLSAIRSRRGDSGSVVYAEMIDYLAECYEQADLSAKPRRSVVAR